MDIGSQNEYPSCALSNFAAHEFYLDGVRCASMEGFLQSLKCKNPEMQKHICSLIGIAAKRAGRERNDWKKRQKLYWQGKSYDRRSIFYQQLQKLYQDKVKTPRYPYEFFQKLWNLHSSRFFVAKEVSVLNCDIVI